MGTRAGIVVTGTEVLTGRVTDRNGPWLAEELRRLGVDVGHVVVVGDRPADLREALGFLAGTGVALGAYVSQTIAVDEMQAMKPTHKKRRCGRPGPECSAYADARAASERAFDVILWSLSASAVIAGGLWGIAEVGDATSRVKVEVVPTVGGAVLRGTF